MSEYVDDDHQKEIEDRLHEEAVAETLRQQKERMGDRLLAKTRAYGKLILFGEHFVVYQVPALVGAVAAYTDCECEVVETTADGAGVVVVDNRPAVPHYKVKKREEGDAAIALVLKHFGLDTSTRHNVKLTFGGDLTCASGIGASAAQVVSLARALSSELPVKMTEDEINAAGYEGEKGYHGTPSGIDNTASTFGGLLRFQRTDGDPLFIKKKIGAPIRIVYASTGITASTSEVVGDVRAKKEADPAWFDGLLQKYLAVVSSAETAIDDGDMKTLGSLLDENHALCQELTVSCKELDDLVLAAREAGALGAKMSGTGRGGLMLALTPTEESQAEVAAALGKLAPQVWTTMLA
jgi:mevalonate kinase